MRGSFRVGTIAGIAIGINYSWILALVLIAWSLAQGFFPVTYRGWTPTEYWVVGVAAALMLFVSVLIHEIAHSLVAKSRGLPVHSITLFIFGGVSNIEKEPEKPGVEFVMSVVGPLSSLVLAGVFYLVYLGVGDTGRPLSAVLNYLAFINALLAAFNILPGFPLDGGRVLRSIIWGATGNLDKATNIASMVGKLFGWAFVAFGVFQLLGGNVLGGLWIAFIGWFLTSAADASRREVSLREQLRGVTVAEVMERNPDVVGPTTSIAAVVQDIFLQRGRRAAPVCSGDRIIGIVTLTDVREVSQDRWQSTTVQNVMTKEPIRYVKETDDLSAALKLLSDHSLNQVVVLKDGRLIGMISRADIIRYLQVQQELGIAPRRPDRAPATGVRE